MENPFYEWLYEKGIADASQIEAFKQKRQSEPFSLFSELRFLWSAGIILSSTALGVLIYRNIASIGHLVLICTVLCGALFCLWLSHRRYEAYRPERILPPGLFMPYVVLAGITLFMAWEGYIAYQYQPFGNDHKWMTLAAALLCLVGAFRFDHLGVLNIGIAALVATIGLSVLPQDWLLRPPTLYHGVAFSGIAMAAALITAGYMLRQRSIKPHFENIFATNATFLGIMCLLWFQFADEQRHWVFLPLAMICGVLYLYTLQIKSVGMYIILVFGLYISATGFLVSVVTSSFYVLFLYYGVISLAGIAYLLIKYKRFLAIES